VADTALITGASGGIGEGLARLLGGGRAFVVPGLTNKIGVQMLRVAPRAMVRSLIRRIQEQKPHGR
jgi:short-subunit dehydrogenase